MKIQDEILVLFGLVGVWLVSIPILSAFNAMSYFVNEGTVLAGMYGAFIAHEGCKILQTGRSDQDE